MFTGICRDVAPRPVLALLPASSSALVSRVTMDADERAQRFAIHAACREGQSEAEQLRQVCFRHTLIRSSAQKVESLLNADRRLVSRRDDDDRLPLHWAASYNRLSIVELLADQKSFDVDAQDGAGWTALMMASSLKDGDAMVDLLLNKGADPNVKTNNGQTAVHFTASKNNLDAARKLVAHGATARVKDKRGQLPLHRAAAVGNVPIIKLMLQQQSPINATDIDSSTALHHAIAEGHGDAAAELLKAGAESDKKDNNGALAIDLAPDAKIRSYILRAAEQEGIEVVTG